MATAPPQHHADEEELDVVDLVGLLVLGVLVSLPRVSIIGFGIVNSALFRDAFGGWVLPAVGFFLMPWTTLAYASMWSISSDVVSGWEWIVVGLGVIVDLYTWSAFRPRKD